MALTIAQLLQETLESPLLSVDDTHERQLGRDTELLSTRRLRRVFPAMDFWQELESGAREPPNQTQQPALRLKGAGMITAEMRYDIRDEELKAFLDTFAQVISVLSETPGHEETHLYKDLVIKNAYLLKTKWRDQSAFERFAGTEFFRNHLATDRTTIVSAAPEVIAEQACVMNPHPRFAAINFCCPQ